MKTTYEEHYQREPSLKLVSGLGNLNGGCSDGGGALVIVSLDSRVVLQPKIATASAVSNSSANSIAITDVFAKTTQLGNYCGNPPP